MAKGAFRRNSAPSRRPKSQRPASTANPVAQQRPTQSNTPLVPDAVNVISSMDDQTLANLVNQSKGVDMPNFLADVHDVTQEFVYTSGLNEKPMVLDDAQFDQYMKDNNISQSEIMSRSVNGISYRNLSNAPARYSAETVSDIIKSSELNYIGGKHGGQMLGAGTYFDMNGGGSTGYGQRTMNAVLNPQKAKVISERQLVRQAPAFAKSHPLFNQAVGGFNTSYKGGSNNMSIWALAMGYNVITDGSGYHNVIDRSALVIREKDR